MQKGIMIKLFKALLVLVAAVIVAILIVLAGIAAINVYMRVSTRIVTTLTSEDQRLTDGELNEIEKLDPECAIVLGAGISDPETPSPMLKDRLDAAVLLYKQGAVKRLLLTGDNGNETHDEIHVMLKYCLGQGVPGSSIFCDHAGFSTYDSMDRADSIYEVKRAVVVTQKYHLPRALYLARRSGIKAVGVASDQRPHSGQQDRDIREVLASVKDFIKGLRDPGATYGGDKIPITGDGAEASHGE